MILLEKNRLTIQQINNKIKYWNINSKIADFQHINTFKYKLKKLSPIPFSFIQNCIIFVMLQKLSWAFKDDIKQFKYKLSLQLKNQYQQIYFKEGWKNDFKFYFLMVLSTKTCCYFIQNNIEDIKIDDNFQSEVFIILMYIVLGVQIGTKSYLSVFQKYKYKQKISKLLDIKEYNIISAPKLQKGQNKQSKESQNQKSSKPLISKNNISSASTKKSFLLGKYNKRRGALGVRHNDIIRFSLISKISLAQDQAQQFQKLVKNNLYVKPLPPPVKKKMTIRQLDYQNQNMPQNVYQKLLPSIDQSMKGKSIFSNQISHSLQYSIHSSFIQLPKLNTSFKINCKPQQNSMHYQMASLIPNINQKKAREQQQFQRQKRRTQRLSRKTRRKDAKAWKQIINQLKDEKYQSLKFDSKKDIKNIIDSQNKQNEQKLFLSLNQSPSDKIKSNIQKNEKGKTESAIIKTTNKNISENSSMIDITRINDTIQQQKIHLNYLKKKQNRTKAQLIRSYKNFMETCQIRDLQIHKKEIGSHQQR